MKKTKIVTLMTVSALVCATAIGGTYAYLTDNEVAKNEFTVGDVQIDLIEKNFPEDQKDHPVVPNEIVKKDPKVKNTGTSDAIVFLEVEIPAQELVTAQADGTRNASARTNLFEFSKTGVFSAGSTNENWVELSSKKNEETNKTTYIFGYKEKVTAGSETNTLFDQVRFANVVEGTVEGDNLEINVRAYAIQASYINDIDLSTLDETTLGNVYDVFAKQNSDALASKTTLKEANTNGDLKLDGTDLGD